MIEQLKSAADQLRAAWDNYYSLYSTLQQYQTQKSALHTYGFPPELSRLLDTELAFVSSFPPKVVRSEIAIRRARNYSSGLAPINALPPEILTRIFHLVIEGPCQFHRPCPNRKDNVIVYPQFPDYLAQGLVNRAWEHTDRADLVPIELHVAGESCYCEDYCEERRHYGYLHDLLRRISHLVETLEIVATGQFGPFHRTVFDGLFNPGGSNLKKLVLCSQGEHHNTFIFPTSLSWHQLDHDLSDFGLNITESQFARGFSTITVLHARGIFPSWPSTAYHGLVDLRLLSTSQYSTIKEAEIIPILKSSPGLRILHFGLEIRNRAPDDEVTSVDLPDLQVVKVFPLNNPDACNILRLLIPGTKPLRLSIEECDKRSVDFITELDKFFARSNVAKFHTQEIFPPFSLLLRHSAHLECAIFSNFDPQSRDELRANLVHVDGQAPPICLKSLRLLNSCLSEDDLHKLLKFCPSGIVLDSSAVCRDGSEDPESTKLSEKELSDAFPTVKIALESVKNATADWELFD
ncbi:hypothetical protein RSAG8_09113, partial [Rhizoctonia solani AG-8 WAC10335]